MRPPPPPTLSSPSPPMGNSEAKPGATDGHAAARAAAPPSSMAGSGPQPCASPVPSSDGQAAAAASPSSSTVNPVAQPRATPIAPSSSSCDVSAGAAPPACCPSPTNLAGSEAGEATNRPPTEYPRRPGVADCSYYAKFGTCGYGTKCWFNHPPRGGSQPPPSTLPRAHKSFSEKASNYNHPEGKIFVEQVKTNFLGLPLRPGAGLCSYYMKQGTCKFGTNCKYHHPDPKSEQVNSNALVHVDEESSEVKQARNERHVPLVTSPTSGTSKFIPSRRKSTCTKRSAYKTVGVSKDILELERDIGVELAHNDSNVQAQSCNPYDGTDWISWSAQIPDVAREQKFWDNIYESQKLCSPSGKQEKFNKHDQLSSQLDSDAQYAGQVDTREVRSCKGPINRSRNH